MKKYRIPINIKEIVLNDDNQLVYFKKELIKINEEWGITTSWELLEEIKND